MAISKLLFFLNIALLISCVFSYQFEVGGDEGWIEPSSANFTSDIRDPYNVWAAQNRFRIGDTIRKFSYYLKKFICVFTMLLVYFYLAT